MANRTRPLQPHAAGVHRRRFLSATAFGAAAWLGGATTFAASAPQGRKDAKAPPDPRADLPVAGDDGKIPYGVTKLGISDGLRDGTMFVPKSYREDVPAPVVVMLHGYSGFGDEMKSTFAIAEDLGVIVVAPDSREVTWGRSVPGFDQDVRYIGAAYRRATELVNIDPDRVALGGRSDGAGYALSMGLAYGDTFNHLIVIAGGMMSPLRRKGKPKVFFAHGTKDQQMPIDRTARLFEKQLKGEGYDVTFLEYDGGHATPPEVVREAFAWLVGPKK